MMNQEEHTMLVFYQIQIKFKTTILKSSLCDYSDAYILVKGNITVNNTAAGDTNTKNINKK